MPVTRKWGKEVFAERRWFRLRSDALGTLEDTMEDCEISLTFVGGETMQLRGPARKDRNHVLDHSVDSMEEEHELELDLEEAVLTDSSDDKASDK